MRISGPKSGLGDKKEWKNEKNIKRGGPSGGAATYGGRPPRRHPQPPSPSPENSSVLELMNFRERTEKNERRERVDL